MDVEPRRIVFELISPVGATYVMQSYAQIVDPTLSIAKLPTLGDTCQLVPGTADPP